MDPSEIAKLVRRVLEEDVGTGDLTADLIADDALASASVIAREPALVCGIDWFNAVFHQLDTDITIEWEVAEGDTVDANQQLCDLHGRARGLLTGERAALNLLQTLSGTATLARQYADAITGLDVQILDTRKTIPGLRLAQKYAVRCGGCSNHRVGLFDAILIKENHIAAAGSIVAAIENARSRHPGIKVEVEVETLDELDQALGTDVDQVLLDNFSNDDLRLAVQRGAGKTILEASGGVSLDSIRAIAETGVDCISVGALTKDVIALDLSMRFNL
ncbi:MAG TPA: carboxylating nicotinate-nucleotide diphosphorylase [Chromatiales bacterium]|nr:carboxylating nicotinate-nucleotide diphosphorylase [Chromatiaceae bacterium]HIN83030.1 carboxylating nicotinate-nucleotide diphosphorylase [Chromatiales bacterium]HIO14795.1 carboxylating nicotinate-nucleotide diphosphorylase [Chromatiales bacterium]HIO54346.1 carboxylating nicotinate-nucleotide diphosphorylase [Chromatiales bacterium]